MSDIFNYNFRDDPKLISEYFQFKLNWDGELFYDAVKGMVIKSNIYKVHNENLLDHIKYLLTTKNMIILKDEGETIFEAEMTATQNIDYKSVPAIYQSRIRNIYEDYRLCSSGIAIFDPINLLSIKILFTNNFIYGFYERRLSLSGNKASFASVIPLCRRDNTTEYLKVGIGIDNTNNIINFYINGVCYYKITQIGFRLPDMYQVVDYGGEADLVKISKVDFGIGHFSFLDHNIPNNYSREYTINSTNTDGYPIVRLASALAQLLPTDKYYEPYLPFSGIREHIDQTITFAYTGTDSSYFIFGQGITSNVIYLKCYYNIIDNICHKSTHTPHLNNIHNQCHSIPPMISQLEKFCNKTSSSSSSSSSSKPSRLGDLLKYY